MEPRPRAAEPGPGGGSAHRGGAGVLRGTPQRPCGLGAVQGLRTRQEAGEPERF